MHSDMSLIETLIKRGSRHGYKEYIGRLVEFSSLRSNLRLLPKYFSQINPNLVSPSPVIVFVYLRGLGGNVLSDEELLSAISLVESLRRGYSDLYREFCSEIETDKPTIGIVFEEFQEVDDSLKTILKCINSKTSKAILSFLDSVAIPKDFYRFILSLFWLVKSDFTGEVMKVVRTSEFYDTLLHIYNHIDSMDSVREDEDWFFKEVVKLIEACLSLEDVPYKITLDYSNYGLEMVSKLSSSVTSLRKELKSQHKLSYESSELLSTEDTALECAVDLDINIPIEDSGISKAQRQDFLSNLSVLVLKADSLSICSLPKNFRVESASRVASSVISSLSFDVVLVLTKALKHCDFYRIRSNVRSKLVLSASTNRGRVLEDVFYSI